MFQQLPSIRTEVNERKVFGFLFYSNCLQDISAAENDFNPGFDQTNASKITNKNWDKTEILNVSLQISILKPHVAPRCSLWIFQQKLIQFFSQNAKKTAFSTNDPSRLWHEHNATSLWIQDFDVTATYQQKKNFLIAKTSWTFLDRLWTKCLGSRVATQTLCFSGFCGQSFHLNVF